MTFMFACTIETTATFINFAPQLPGPKLYAPPIYNPYTRKLLQHSLFKYFHPLAFKTGKATEIALDFLSAQTAIVDIGHPNGCTFLSMLNTYAPKVKRVAYYQGGEANQGELWKAVRLAHKLLLATPRDHSYLQKLSELCAIPSVILGYDLKKEWKSDHGICNLRHRILVHIGDESQEYLENLPHFLFLVKKVMKLGLSLTPYILVLIRKSKKCLEKEQPKEQTIVEDWYQHIFFTNSELVAMGLPHIHIQREHDDRLTRIASAVFCYDLNQAADFTSADVPTYLLNEQHGEKSHTAYDANDDLKKVLQEINTCREEETTLCWQEELRKATTEG